MLPTGRLGLALGALLTLAAACGGDTLPIPSPTASEPAVHSPSPVSGPPSGRTPTAHPTATAATETPSPAPTTALDIAWFAAGGDSEFTAFDVISDATAAGPALVAVGSYDDGSVFGGAAAWFSADGATWRRAPTVPGARQAAMEDVTLGPAGLVAVGYSFNDDGVQPAVWVSPDGQDWQYVRDADLGRGQMSAVAANSLGYVVVGYDPDTEEGLTWMSRDGRDWTPSVSVPSFEVQPSVNDVVALAQGFMAYGSTSRNERAALWFSRDGQDWQLVAGFPTGPSSAVHAVVASGIRLVAVGASYLERGSFALAWASDDGLEWRRVLDEDAGEEGEMLSVVPLGTGFLAVGESAGQERQDFRAAVWSSPDGLSWQRQPHDPNFDLARMSEVIRAGPGLVALGERASDPAMEEFTPAAWLGVAR